MAAMHEEKGAVPWQVSFAAGTASGAAAASSSAAGSASEEAESGAAASSSVCTAAAAGAGALKEGVDFVIDDFTQKGPENLLDDDITGFTEVTMELKMRKSPAKQRKLQPVPLQPKEPPKVPLKLGRFGNRGGKLKEWWKAFHHAKKFGKESLNAFLVAHPKPFS